MMFPFDGRAVVTNRVVFRRRLPRPHLTFRGSFYVVDPDIGYPAARDTPHLFRYRALDVSLSCWPPRPGVYPDLVKP